MRVLVTGGAGYIGSHTVLALLDAGHEVIVVDNLCNSSVEALRRVEKLAGKSLTFYELDILETAALHSVFAERRVDAVIHFAALKAVGESVEQPLRYYHNNVSGTLGLCRMMEAFGVRALVFSSSCTVYGDVKQMPLREDMALGQARNPYGRGKQMIEAMLRDLTLSDPSWHVCSLRYFNPIGAHESGQIGEDPQGVPNNLLPYVAQVAVGRRPYVRVFGGDYETDDGTAVRDYVHVMDVAAGHVLALERAEERKGYAVYNLGTGRGHSVLEVIAAFGEACGRDIPYRIEGRRPGDAAAAYADSSKAKCELGWTAGRDLAQMCADTWRWQSGYPGGFG